MMTLMNDGAWRRHNWKSAAAGRMKTTIDLAAERVLADSTLIDQVIAQVFDQLGQRVIELRIQGGAMASDALKD